MNGNTLTVRQKILLCCDKCSQKIGKPKEGNRKIIKSQFGDSKTGDSHE
ncbi:MAG: hypothetical protein ABSB71_11255 [Candidatus Bathyarchaeia archaeon]